MLKSLTAAIAVLCLAVPAWAHNGVAHESHHHVAPHGGVVRSVKPYHFELVTSGKHLQVYLFDNKMKALPAKGRTGEAVLQLDGKTQRIKLVPVGDAFQAPVDLSKANKYVAVVSLGIDGKTMRGRFEQPAD
jgi:hypothetical protein